MMETNNYTTNLQLVSQEYSDEKTFGKLRD